VGEKETRPAKNAVRTIINTVPNSQGMMIPKLGHIWSLQNPELFTATVIAWINDAPLPAVLRPITNSS
jgi:hypothetical protein